MQKDKEFGFFITTMPSSRPADYCIGCFDGSVFIDFDKYENGRVQLKRISFDGYGCCELKKAIPMNEIDSNAFKKIMKTQLVDQLMLTEIVNRTIFNNKEFIWQDALTKYDLL